MFFYLEGFGFSVEVVDGRQTDKSRSDAKDRVLVGLKFFMDVSLVFGNQMRKPAEKVKREPIKDLNVANIVSLCWPKFVPHSRRSRFSLGFAFLTLMST